MKTYHYVWLALAVCVVGLSGCSKEKMEDMVSQATEAASGAASTVASEVKTATDTAVSKATNVVEQAGDLSGVADMTGKATMTLDKPTEFAASYVRLLTMNPGRSSVLQIKSYKDGETESYPAFLVQAQVEETDIAALAGKTIPAKIFAQKVAGGAVWHSADDQPASLAITITEGKVSAAIANSPLMNTETGAVAATSASFECASLE